MTLGDSVGHGQLIDEKIERKSNFIQDGVQGGRKHCQIYDAKVRKRRAVFQKIQTNCEIDVVNF
jgi:hypothetical protein